MGIWGSFRYRKNVLQITDTVLSPLGKRKSKQVLRVGFWGTGWKRFVTEQYQKGASIHETASAVIMFSLRGVIARTMTPDQRAITLYAIRTGNSGDNAANHFIAILNGLRLIAPQMEYRAAIHEIIGSLEGYQGEELDNYRSARLLEEVLEPYDAAGRQ